jgi:hypothetical protein
VNLANKSRAWYQACERIPKRKAESRKRGDRSLALGIMLMLVAVTAGLWWPWLAARLLYAPAVASLLESISRDPILLEAVRGQNRRLAHVSEAYITALDDVWSAEKDGGALAAAMLDTSASRRLRELLGATRGVVRHAILMDARGLNVAIAYPTTDYFQGDEPKWLMTFGRPSTTRHKGPIETGHDGKFPACWVSAPLNEAHTKAAIGAFSVEVDALLVRDRWCRRN